MPKSARAALSAALVSVSLSALVCCGGSPREPARAIDSPYHSPRAKAAGRANPGEPPATRAAEDYARQQSSAEPAPISPGLGTRWGERRESRLHEVQFLRALPARPFQTVTFHYNDELGVERATGRGYAESYPGIANLRGGAVSVSVVDSNEDPLPLVLTGERRYIIGQPGDRYMVRIQNHTGERLEVVTSIDGLDALDGSTASYRKRGYVVEPWNALLVEGFRDSRDSVRAFRFSSVRESYAVRRGKGRNVGVIGIALFGEQGSHFDVYESDWRRNSATPFPGQYAPAPPQ